jgi:hypothetical protein
VRTGNGARQHRLRGVLLWPCTGSSVAGASAVSIARWFDIGTNAKLGGTDVGAIEIDPYAFGVTIGHRFQ